MSRTRPVTRNPDEDPPPLDAKIEVRIPAELKAAARAKAAEKGVTVSEQLRKALERWVAS